MNIIIVGSMALKRHIPTIKVGKDIDYIMTYDDYKKFLLSCENVISHYPINKGKKMIIKTDKQIYEIEIAWEGTTAEEYMNLVLKDPMTMSIGDINIPSMQALYTMKMSHRYLRNSPFFLKTMQHIRLMRDQWDDGDIITPYWSDWYKHRMDETYWYNHPNLNTTKNDFFKDESFYKYDHDDVHTAVKLGDKPAYIRILADGSPVKCDKAKFDALPYQYKLHCALEECYTLALERSQIPNDYKPNPKKSFDIALMKVCTSITSGWFREWCWENYYIIESAYDESYVIKFKDFLERGLIRKFKHDTMAVN